MSGNSINYKEDYYHVKNVKFSPTSIKRRIPIRAVGMWPNKPPFRRAAQYGVVLPFSINWSQRLTPIDVKQILEYITQNRTTTENLDVLIAGETPRDSSEGFKIIKPYWDVGVTL
ncbi:MAG: hypothetical protein ACFFG0_37025 [Candidatus Thorarchaeota archaeon]